MEDAVREDEFRSRWADYQVDKAQVATAGPADETDDQGGLLSAFGRSFNDHFRTGPLQLRADLSAGYEFTNEEALKVEDPHGTESSPFLGPALGVFYNQELGPLTISARYSVGYVYYLDQSYLVADHNGGIFSQTAGLNLALEGKRTALHSVTSASDGNGEDIESGELRNQLSISEALDGIYTLTDFTQVGASGQAGYISYSGGTVDNTTTTTITGQIFADYVITGKTRLRLELGAGDETQTSPGAPDSDLSFYQALLHVNYLPAPKLSLDGGLGWGVQNNTAVLGQPGTDSHPVYTITVSYAPTEKTSAAVHVGYEGTDINPDFSLGVNYQPRQNTTVSLSIYQNSNFSTFQAAENLTTRGALLSIQQRFFEKVQIALSTGTEQSEGYLALDSGRQSGFSEPYYFGGVSLLWQFNPSFALQGYYRGYTGEAGLAVTGHGLQSTASLSLRLTF